MNTSDQEHQSHRVKSTSTSSRPIKLRFIEWLLSHLEYGTLTVEWGDGRSSVFSGQKEGPDGSMVVKDHESISKLIARGSVGFAEAYIDGRWSTPDLTGLLHNLALNAPAFRRAVPFKAPLNSIHRVIHFQRANTKLKAAKNIAYHYDLGNDFYSRWLDETMAYSCGLFQEPDDDLRQAQINKWDRIIEIGEIGPSDHVLEIGSGWGGFAVHAVKKTGCHVTGITISKEQYDWSCKLVAREGLQDHVDIQLQDYRHVDGKFEKVVSIEMFEAVGERYWQVFFNAVRDRLRPGGLAALQVITIDDNSFEAYRRRPDFIQIHVFPGGMLPSHPRFEQAAKLSGLKTKETAFFGEHYAKTLLEWSKRFEQSVAADPNACEEKLKRLWRYYLSYCIAGFKTGNVNLMQTVLVNDGGR